MAHMGTRWERSDRKLDAEERISPAKARQGRTGYRILTVLIVALVLAFLVWIPVAIWGQKQATDIAPLQLGHEMQSQLPAAPAQNATPAQPLSPAQ